VIILDDGFQHRSLDRNIDIVLLDSQDERRDYKLIPYGKLREPIKHLKRADILVFTKTNITNPSPYLMKVSERISIPTIKSHIKASNTLYNGNKSIPVHKNNRALAVSALGDHRGFHKTLEQIGLEVIEKITFLDHHDYVQKDIDKIIDKAEIHKADIIVTSEKDLVKLKKYNFGENKLFSLPIHFQIESKSEKELFNYIERSISP
jgi:tetraacyldisaccharide 4'-kinase